MEINLVDGISLRIPFDITWSEISSAWEPEDCVLVRCFCPWFSSPPLLLARPPGALVRRVSSRIWLSRILNGFFSTVAQAVSILYKALWSMCALYLSIVYTQAGFLFFDVYSLFILKWIYTSTLLDVLVSVSIVCRRSGGLKRTTKIYNKRAWGFGTVSNC